MAKLTLIPLYLEASSKQELVAKMLKNNLSHGMSFKYLSPIKDGKKWVVWYYGDIEKHFLREGIQKQIDVDRKDGN